MFIGRGHGVMFTIIETGHSDLSSNPRWDCLSYSTNTLRNGMDPNIPPAAMSKLQGRHGSLTWV